MTMATAQAPDPFKAIAALLEPEDDATDFSADVYFPDGEAEPPGDEPEACGQKAKLPPGVDADVLLFCAGLDHSDTDNATRLLSHFGKDFTVLAQDGVPGGDFLVWTGTHWDMAAGAARARLLAQKLGDLIKLEARLLGFGEAEKAAVEAAKAAGFDIDRIRNDAKAVKDAGHGKAVAAIAALAKRRAARVAFGVTSKNHARMEKALECAAPRLRRPPEAFNPDRLTFACLSHTIGFDRIADPECPDPDIERFSFVLKAEKAHRRGDWMTAAVPVNWHGLAAPAPKWRRFLAERLPDAEKRRTVQQFAAFGLFGIPVQYVMFHYGHGANGKSVFLETLTRLIGDGFAVGLPRESIIGAGERGAGSASPDLVRLFGKRMVRILEVKGDVPLQEDLIKRLTGGEAFPVRTLFKGYFEFQSVATPHMSGNAYPTIDGTDDGIWRRMLVVFWSEVIPESERREFEEVVAEFIGEEGPGILAWMVEGMLDYLNDGFYIAPSVRVATEKYREEMDPISEFAKACLVMVSPAESLRVSASDMYDAYRRWSEANAKRVRTQKKFGAVMGQKLEKTQISGRYYYLNCRLQDVPDPPAGYP